MINFLWFISKKKKIPPLARSIPFTSGKKKSSSWGAPSQTYKPCTKIKDISSLFQSYCTIDVGPHSPERSHDPPTTVGSSLETRVSHTGQRSTQKNETRRTNLVEISSWFAFINTLTPTSSTAHTKISHKSIAISHQTHKASKPSLSLSNINTNTQPSF